MIAPTAYNAADPVAPTPSGSWFVQFARLIRWELFLVWRRRAMMITLGSLLLAGYLLVLLIEYLLYFNTSAGSTESSTPQLLGEALSFPGALGVSGAYVSTAGVLLFVVLAGALIGSEFGYSTLRLSLSRGVARGQLLAAQIVALAILALILVAAVLLLGVLIGGMGSLFGLPQSPAADISFGEVALYWLALAYNIFAYALVAVWIGTLTRSIAGATAGPLVFLVIEVVTTSILTVLKDAPTTSPMLTTITHIPEYLMGFNTNALITMAASKPYDLALGEATVSVWHALIVSAVYCVLFIFISYLALSNRDVVE